MDEDTDFEFMKGSEDDGVVPPERVTFAFKGVQDYTLEMIARFLDETNQDHGDTIKRWRQQGKGIKKLWLNDKPIATLKHDDGFSIGEVPLTLQAGRNVLRIKLSNSDNEEWRCWAFSCVIEDAKPGR